MCKITFGILLTLLMGCKNFEAKRISSEEILKEELEEVNWNEVDTYPAFGSCQELMEKSVLQQCFETTLAEQLYQTLSKHKIISSDSINEPVILHLAISAGGDPTIDSIAISKKLEEQFPELKSWLASGIAELPKIHPATTRGIPVATKFTLPIRVVSE